MKSFRIDLFFLRNFSVLHSDEFNKITSNFLFIHSHLSSEWLCINCRQKLNQLVKNDRDGNLICLVFIVFLKSDYFSIKKQSTNIMRLIYKNILIYVSMYIYLVILLLHKQKRNFTLFVTTIFSVFQNFFVTTRDTS